MSDATTLTIDAATATLTLNRPDARNAMSSELLDGIHAALDALERETSVSVVTITGAGRSFCAGMDLKAVLADPPSVRGLLESLARACLRIRALPAVTVASINGAAIGGGCGLAMVCDLALSHADAKLGFPEVDLGACPAVVAPWLVRKIGPGRARCVLLQGGVLDGRRAHELGLTDA
ncbi:MAG: enoyl-CoA hydratase/isomerase family protein, partial [Planctomycetota bacterium]